MRLERRLSVCLPEQVGVGGDEVQQERKMSLVPVLDAHDVLQIEPALSQMVVVVAGMSALVVGGEELWHFDALPCPSTFG